MDKKIGLHQKLIVEQMELIMRKSTKRKKAKKIYSMLLSQCHEKNTKGPKTMCSNQMRLLQVIISRDTRQLKSKIFVVFIIF